MTARGARASFGGCSCPPPVTWRSRGAARLSGSRPGGWHRSISGFIRRTLQAADEDNIPFLASALTFDALLASIPFILLLLIGFTLLAQNVTYEPEVDTSHLFDQFLPPSAALPDRDPLNVLERLLSGIARNRGELSLYAAPAFLWFSTRLFAGIRTALNDIYDVSLRPTRHRAILTLFVLAKLRDASMVIATVILFLANTLLSTGLAVLQARGAASVPQLGFFVSTVGRFLGEFLAFSFSVSLFYVTYSYASLRRLPWRTALLASTFTALLFELAKRLYALYLANFASFEGLGGDANLGAIVLFVLWVYYTALVFLLGAVVAETWELKKMLDRQQAILG
ncbi:MAG TPA: YihY/virulence factor BrkB family protein [Gemmatimonadales bacterium]|nr:YihY/virulence factor BrkB family protein [Gemmatimonadales bacterium]